MLSSGFTSVSQTIGMLPASTSQSGVNVRMRSTTPRSTRARTRNSSAARGDARTALLNRVACVHRHAAAAFQPADAAAGVPSEIVS
jgi:hypothetical protein